MTSPCKDCTDRHAGCHGECERYQEYCQQREEAKAKRKAQYAGDIYLFAKMKKLKKIGRNGK